MTAQKRVLLDDDYSDDKDTVINDEYLLGYYILLSKKEYLDIYPLGIYEKYLEAFFKDGIYQAYKKFGRSNWFQDRYFTKKENKESGIALEKDEMYGYTNATTSYQFYFCKGADRQKYAQDEIEKYMEISGVKEVFTKQNTMRNNYVVDFYLRSTENLELPENNPVKFGRIKETYKITQSLLVNLVRFFSKRENKEFSGLENKTHEELTFLLRCEFNFCTTCCKQFDSRAEMIDKCMYHIQNDVIHRHISLISDISDINFKEIEYGFNDSEVNNKIRICERNEYECIECRKVFEGKDNVVSHIKNKHVDIWEEMEKRNEEFNTFVNNIDLFILSWICQFEKFKYKPIWAFVKTKQNRVLYDLKEYYNKIK